MARRVADRTLRSDVTGGRPRAVVLAIVRRLPLRLCAAAIFIGRNETDKRKRAPTRTGGGARFGTGARCCRIVFAAGLGRCVRSGAAQFLRGWPDCARKCDGRGDGGAARGVRLTGLFSWRPWRSCRIRSPTRTRTRRTEPARAARTRARRFLRTRAAALAMFAAYHARGAAAHAVSRCCFGDRAAFAFAIARCGSCWRKERNGQTGNAPPARTGGGACFGTGCIRSGVWPDFSRRRGRRGDGARRAACD